MDGAATGQHRGHAEGEHPQQAAAFQLWLHTGHASPASARHPRPTAPPAFSYAPDCPRPCSASGITIATNEWFAARYPDPAALDASLQRDRATRQRRRPADCGRQARPWAWRSDHAAGLRGVDAQADQDAARMLAPRLPLPRTARAGVRHLRIGRPRTMARRGTAGPGDKRVGLGPALLRSWPPDPTATRP